MVFSMLMCGANPAYSALEDALREGAERNTDLERLVRTLRRLQNSDLVDGELNDLISRLDTTPLPVLRDRLLRLLPAVSRDALHKERRTPLQNRHHEQANPGESPNLNAWGDQIWFDAESTHTPSTSLYLQTWNNHSEQDGVLNFDDFQADSSGYMLGIERSVASNWFVGFGVGIEQTDIDSSIFGADEVDAHHLSAIAGYAAGRHWVSLSWRQGTYQTDRVRVLFVPNAGALRTLNLSSNFDTVRTDIEVGYAAYFEPSLFFSISPFVTAGWGRLDTENYTERGGGAFNLNVDTAAEDQFFGSAGVTVSRFYPRETISFTPALTAAIEHDFNSEVITTVSRFRGTSDRFLTTGNELSETRWRMAASVTVAYRDRAQLALSYEAHRKDDYHYDGVILTLQLDLD